MSVSLSALGRVALLFLLVLVAAPTPAHADDAAVQTTWRLLDYIAVDYAGAVADGRVISETEYAEMREFSASVGTRIAALPAHPQRAALQDGARRLEAAILAKA